MFKREKSQLSPYTWRKHELFSCTLSALSQWEDCIFLKDNTYYYLNIKWYDKGNRMLKIKYISMLLKFWISHVMQRIYFRLSALPLWLKCSTRRFSSVFRNQHSILLWLEQAIWVSPLHQKSGGTLSYTEGWPRSPGGIPTQNRPCLIYQRRTGNACMQTNPSLSP